MPLAQDIGDPLTLARLLFALTYFLALAMHMLLRGRYLWLSSLLLVGVMHLVLYSTLYRDAFRMDAMAGIGAILGFTMRFTAAIFAGMTVRLVRRLMAARS